MLAVRDGAGWQAGTGRLPPLLLPADHAVLPRKVSVVKIERGHGTAGGREAPDPAGTHRGRGSSEGTLFFGGTLFFWGGHCFLGTSAPGVGVFPVGDERGHHPG